MLSTILEDLRLAGSASALIIGVGIGAYLGIKAGARLYRDAEEDARRLAERARARARELDARADELEARLEDRDPPTT
jgi:hypothetical protein